MKKIFRNQRNLLFVVIIISLHKCLLYVYVKYYYIQAPDFRYNYLSIVILAYSHQDHTFTCMQKAQRML